MDFGGIVGLIFDRGVGAGVYIYYGITFGINDLSYMGSSVVFFMVEGIKNLWIH